MAVNNTTEGLRWRHQDYLGSLRVKTDSTGVVKCRHSYYPCGELWSSTYSENDARKFTDKERDPESGLDYFGARYCTSVHGRFTSVDPLPESGVLEDPQTLNRYLYVRNNPTGLLDPDGGQIIAPASVQEAYRRKREWERNIENDDMGYKGLRIFVLNLIIPDPSILPNPATMVLGSGMKGLGSGLARAFEKLENIAYKELDHATFHLTT